MSILKGIIKDLKDDETHIAGCTTPDEIIIALESADSRLDNAIEYNKFTTNGELFEKAHNPFKVIRYEKAHAVHVYLTEKDFLEACHHIIFEMEWYDAPYRKNESNNMPSETYKKLFGNPK